MVAPFNKFYCKMWVGFCLNTGKRFFLEVSKPTERALVLLKYGNRDFQNSPPFEILACFYVTINGNSERFRCFNFEIDFSENENFFHKIGVPFFS